jgi:hypothetical protein
MLLNSRRITLVISVLALAGGQAFGQQDDEGADFDADIGLEFRDYDNFYQSFANEQATQATVLDAALRGIFPVSQHRFEIGYAGQFGRHNETFAETDDYDDQEADLGAFFAFGRRFGLDLTGSLRDAHEFRGTGLSQGFEGNLDTLVPEPDQYQVTESGLRFTAGDAQSKGTVSFELGTNDLEYQNNRSRTQEFDRDSAFADIGFGVLVAPNTRIVFNLRGTQFEYPYARTFGPTLDNDEVRALVGVTWEATAKVEGSIRLGYVKKKYESTQRPEFSAPSWDVNVIFHPRTYSRITLSTSRFPTESTALSGDVTDNSRLGVAWHHEWSDRVATEFGIARTEEDFRAQTEGRVQDLTSYSLTITYNQREWLGWQMGVDVNSRESTVDRFSYDGTTIRIGARLSF